MNASGDHRPDSRIDTDVDCRSAGMPAVSQRLTMRDKMIRMYLRTAAVVLALTASISGCSGSDNRPDAAADAGVDADVPEVPCEQMQREYVNSVLAPGQQTDVVQAVTAVLGAADFPQAMPYCSGPRPGTN
jgi:hypothetical protein